MTIALVLVAAVFAFAWWTRRRLMLVVVTGNSMLPSLTDGERRIARRIVGAPREDLRNKVVVFKLLEHEAVDELGYLVKRAVAVAGDPVPPQVREALGLPAHALVPPGSVAVLGDNPISKDSRHLGFISVDRLVSVIPDV